MKGSTKIILTNVETGEQEIHEDTNLITNALDKIINMATAMNIAPNNAILPIATLPLGGIMLFDGQLTEEADNIHFPVEAHIVGYADRSTNTTDKYRGSYNNIESGKTERGYVSVWDFGTTQANGTIRAVARTSNQAGACPFYFYRHTNDGRTWEGSPNNDKNWYPIRYDGEYVYMVKADTTNHNMRLARVKIPMLRMGVADYSEVGRTYDVIASWNTLLTDFTWYDSKEDMIQDRNPHTQYVYADSVNYYRDGHDGFIYCVGFGVYNRTWNTYQYDLTYFTINYGDGSYEKSEVVRVKTGISNYMNTGNYFRWPEPWYGHVHNGILYILSSNRKSIIKIPLANPASYSTFRVFADSNRDYIENLERIISHEGAIYFEAVHYTAQDLTRHYGVMYPDGVFVLPEVNYSGSVYARRNSSYQYDSYCLTCDDDLVIWGCYGDDGSDFHGAITRAMAANYLGTINNLSSPITKTAAQTMKIVYTLTDVNDEDEEG